MQDKEGKEFRASLGNPFMMRSERDRADVIEAMRLALQDLMQTGSADIAGIARDSAGWRGRSGMPLRVHEWYKLHDADGLLLRAGILTIAEHVVEGFSFQLECVRTSAVTAPR